MKNVGKPKITSPKPKAGHVQISFTPDYKRFGCENLSDDMFSLFYKNVVDTAMLTGVNVYFNGEKIPMKTLKDYASRGAGGVSVWSVSTRWLYCIAREESRLKCGEPVD